jgi:hypothetical protein
VTADELLTCTSEEFWDWWIRTSPRRRGEVTLLPPVAVIDPRRKRTSRGRRRRYKKVVKIKAEEWVG